MFQQAPNRPISIEQIEMVLNKIVYRWSDICTIETFFFTCLINIKKFFFVRSSSRKYDELISVLEMLVAWHEIDIGECYLKFVFVWKKKYLQNRAKLRSNVIMVFEHCFNAAFIWGKKSIDKLDEITREYEMVATPLVFILAR